MRQITQLILALMLGGAGACNYESNPSDPSYDSIPVAQPLLASAGEHTGFGFNGIAGGRVFLAGGGSVVATSGSNDVGSETTIVSGGGGFRCLAAVAQGALSGCGEGEGVRWEAVQLLASANFRCTGADAVKTGVTTARTVAILADFYRAGDGNEASLRAQIIVSESDIAADVPGVQTLWVQGVGCDEAQVSFSGR